MVRVDGVDPRRELHRLRSRDPVRGRRRREPRGRPESSLARTAAARHRARRSARRRQATPRHQALERARRRGRPSCRSPRFRARARHQSPLTRNEHRGHVRYAGLHVACCASSSAWRRSTSSPTSSRSRWRSRRTCRRRRTPGSSSSRFPCRSSSTSSPTPTSPSASAEASPAPQLSPASSASSPRSGGRDGRARAAGSDSEPVDLLPILPERRLGVVLVTPPAGVMEVDHEVAVVRSHAIGEGDLADRSPLFDRLPHE